MVKEGDRAPGFTLSGTDADGHEATWALADFLGDGKRLVLYFYPRDHTSGCTTEACDFRDSLDRIRTRATVVGVSPDSPASHEKFRARHGLNFPLLSDPERQALAAYGAWGEKTMYGKKTMGVIRSTFVIGPDGVIERLWRKVRVKGHVDAVLVALDALGV